MRSKAILITALCLMAGMAYAAVTTTLTVPTAKVRFVEAMIDATFDSHITIHVQGSQNAADPNRPDFTLDASIQFRPDPNDPNETTVQKFERLQELFITALTKANQKKIKAAADQAAKDALVPSEIDMPDTLFE